MIDMELPEITVEGRRLKRGLAPDTVVRLAWVLLAAALLLSLRYK